VRSDAGSVEELLTVDNSASSGDRVVGNGSRRLHSLEFTQTTTDLQITKPLTITEWVVEVCYDRMRCPNDRAVDSLAIRQAA